MASNQRFYIDTDNSYAVLLGYIMKLTKSEFAILKHIDEGEGFVSASQLLEGALADKGITLGNIAVHVCNINKKAKAISGRPLIKVRRFKGYRLSDRI